MDFIAQQNILEEQFKIFLVYTFLLCACMIIYNFFAFRYDKKRLANMLLSIAYYRKLLETNQDIMSVALIKPEFRFEYMSPSITPLTGYAPQDFYNSPDLFESLIHPDDLLQLIKELRKIAKNGNDQIVSFRLRKSDQSFANIEAKVIPGFDQNGNCTEFYIVARKTSLDSKLLKDTSYFERLNIVSKMSSGVAHEVRNPMTTVRGYLQYFSEKTEFVKYKKQFDLIINELDRTNLIIKEYLTLNQNKLSTPKLCQLNNIISSFYPLLKAYANSINKDIKISLGNIPELLISENEIRQLILNIVKNGLESMVELKDRTFVNISTYVDGTEVVMSIKDQGTGIPTDILNDVGKRILTTKEQGTGLGLVVCYQIAANHNAQIKVNTNHNGTDFLIRFSLPQTFG